MSPKPARTLLLALCLAAAQGVHAEANCTIYSSAVSFGNYDVLSGTPLDSTGTILIICQRNPPPNTQNVAYTLKLTVGAGSFAARTMSGPGGHTIAYNLYTSPAMTPATIWGNGTSGSTVVGGALQSLTAASPIRLATETIYGRIPARQDVPIGSYSGSVVLSMDF